MPGNPLSVAYAPEERLRALISYLPPSSGCCDSSVISETLSRKRDKILGSYKATQKEKENCQGVRNLFMVHFEIGDEEEFDSDSFVICSNHVVVKWIALCYTDVFFFKCPGTILIDRIYLIEKKPSIIIPYIPPPRHEICDEDTLEL